MALVALGALLVIGAAIRVVATFAWWPVGNHLADSAVYASYAARNPLADPFHPAGYPALLAAVGAVSHEVALVVVLQHLLGLATGVLLFAAVRRTTGSPWPALFPAAVPVLGADQIMLEHNVMSEGPFVALLSASAYAAIRAFDGPRPWWRWPMVATILAVAATVVRSTGLFFIPVLLLAILLADPAPLRRAWRAPAAVAGVALALLAAYASANLASNDRFEVGPAQGWHLYIRVAPFADCRQFTPPAGTRRLCETIPAKQRPGLGYYGYDPTAPANRLFGPEPWAKHDKQLGAFARQAILHQPVYYAKEMWRDLAAYYVPSSRTPRVGEEGGLDPQLDWTATGYEAAWRRIGEDMDAVFFNGFQSRERHGLLVVLHDYQRIFRFGATLLTLCTVLTLVGLLVGTRRSRAAVLLFGVGGLALLVAPTLSVYYVGRYTVPLAPLLAAAAATTVWSFGRWLLDRRRPAASDSISLSDRHSDAADTAS